MKRSQSFREITKWGYLLILTAVFFAAQTGCLSKSENEVVVYSALDREFSKPIMDDYSELSGVVILPKFDVESNKTVGLANEIIGQRKNQRCDLFWNNEILHTLRLKKLGLLETYHSPLANQYPDAFVSSDGDWHGFAARARVLIINTDLIPIPADRPTSIRDLADSKWQGKCAIARPLFGTTATHVAVLFAEWGETDARKFLQDVATNARTESGNKQVAINVARGRYAFGLTDTDDAIIELEAGNPVAIVFPDQETGGLGTLFIPNTLAIIKGGPNTENAKRLVDHLLSAEIESRLAKSQSAQIPLNKNANVRSRVEPEGELKRMKVDFQAAADVWPKVTQFVEETFPVGGK